VTPRGRALRRTARRAARPGTVGTAALTLPDGRVIEYPLETGADVARMGVVGRVTTMIQHYLFGWLS
jgi:D-alanyl-D-alanine carboxypeptidase (penicillin-binding protein 5/6)